MKTAICDGPGQFRIKESERHEPKRGWVQVENRATGICGSDLHGWRSENPQLIGKVLGHEISGVVSEVGDDVGSVSLGDPLAVEPLVGCGECIYCRTGRINLCDDLRIIGMLCRVDLRST